MDKLFSRRFARTACSQCARVSCATFFNSTGDGSLLTIGMPGSLDDDFAWEHCHVCFYVPLRRVNGLAFIRRTGMWVVAITVRIACICNGCNP